MISKQLAGKVIVAKVKYNETRVGTLDTNLKNPEVENEAKGDGWMMWDATRLLEGSCELQLITFDSAEGKDTFWHSSAHVLGQTLETEFGVHLCFGPATTDGFFYDTYTGKDVSLFVAWINAFRPMTIKFKHLTQFCLFYRSSLISTTKPLKMQQRRSSQVTKSSPD